MVLRLDVVVMLVIDSIMIDNRTMRSHAMHYPQPSRRRCIDIYNSVPSFHHRTVFPVLDPPPPAKKRRIGYTDKKRTINKLFVDYKLAKPLTTRAMIVD